MPSRVILYPLGAIIDSSSSLVEFSVSPRQRNLKAMEQVSYILLQSLSSVEGVLSHW